MKEPSNKTTRGRELFRALDEVLLKWQASGVSDEEVAEALGVLLNVVCRTPGNIPLPKVLLAMDAEQASLDALFGKYQIKLKD